MKSRAGKRQREEKDQKKEEQKRKSLSKKKEDADARKGRKVAKHCVFPMIWERVQSQLARWEMKSCTPLWREAHLEVKMLKTPGVRTTFGSCDVKKVHAVVVRERTKERKKERKKDRQTERKKERKSEHIVKMCKTHHTRTTLGSWHVEKAHAVVARSTFPSQNVKKDRMVGPLLKLQMWFCVAGAGILHVAKSEKNVRVFVAFLKAMAGVGHLKRIWKDAFRVAGAVQETCSSGILGGLGADFLRRVAFWSIRSSGLLRWFCVTCAALRMTWHHFFVAGATFLHRWSGKIAKHIGTRPSALHPTFHYHYWRKSRRIASFLMLPTSKIKEVSQTCFVFDVIKFKSWGGLAELLRFTSCHLRKWRKPCRIASFSSLQIDR